MKFFKFFILALPILLMSSAFAVNTYQAPKDDINTNTGTFPVNDDDEVKTPSDKQLEMQKEEAPETQVDSFGQDEFNENVDPDTLDDNDNYNY